MVCRRSILQAGVVGASALTLGSCAQQRALTAATPSEASSSAAPPVYGPAVPLGPFAPTSAAPTPARVTHAATTTAVQNPPPVVTTFAPAPTFTPPTFTQPTAVPTTSVPPQPAQPPAGAIAYAKDVPVGQSRLVQTPSNAYILVTRTGQTSIVGFSAACTHQGCTVSGNFQCPCHGSVFDPKTGAVRVGPALTPLPPIGVKIQGEYIVQT